MPKLLRLHFSGVGHEDARLSPLTLDFKDEAGAPTDSILWLRNGGGKSSIINLFFSLFRPQLSEFLGAKAEGKSRRLEQYIKGCDLSFIVSEWQLDAGGTKEAGSKSTPRICIVGRYLAWRDQCVSTDNSRLRKRFFSYSPTPETPSFEQLPINGLGSDSAPTFAAFREWLSTLQAEHPEIGLVDTQNQREWGEHLERLGVDPQLFKYQAKMNEREGAADEAFRFGSAAEFVEFLLELAFDPLQANLVSSNLASLKDQLAQRPELLLEQEFIGNALSVLTPLVEATSLAASALQARNDSLTRLSATRVALSQRCDDLSIQRKGAEEACSRWEQLARERGNERDKHQRWAGGMERKGLELEIDECEVHLGNEQSRSADALLQKSYIKAALVTQKRDEREARRTELQEQLRQEQAHLAPERGQLEAAGTQLKAALAQEGTRLSAELEDLDTRIDVAKTTRLRRESRKEELLSKEGSTRQEITGLRARLDQRNRERERLLKRSLIELRESAEDASERWREEQLRLESKLSMLDQSNRALDSEREESRLRLQSLIADKTRISGIYEELLHEQDDARQWQDRLVDNQCIAEIEGVDEPDLRSEGLLERLLAEASRATSQRIELKVEGAEDERSLSVLSSEGLLPAPLDVERSCQMLKEQGLNAHTGYRYLAENVPLARRRELIAEDPSTFAGIIIVADSLPDRHPLDAESLLLRAPIEVSIASKLDLQAASPPKGGWLLQAHEAVFCEGAALEMRGKLQAAKHERDRLSGDLLNRSKGYQESADELQRFLKRYGGALLDQLVERCETHGQAILGVGADIAELERSYESLGSRQRANQKQSVDSNRLQLAAKEALSQLDNFVREHEQHLEQRRNVLDSLQLQLQEIQGERATTSEELATAEALQHILRGEHYELGSHVSKLTTEGAAVAYSLAIEAEQEDTPTPPLELARTRYVERYLRWQGHTTEDRLVWDIEQTSEQITQLQKELNKKGPELNKDKLLALSQDRDLDSQLDRAVVAIELLRDSVAKARAVAAQLKERLASIPRRREASDLPHGQDVPRTSKQARQRALELRHKAEQLVEKTAEAEAQVKADGDRAQKLGLQVVAHQRLEEGIILLVEGADLELPMAAPSPLLETSEEIEGEIRMSQEFFGKSRRKLAVAEEQARNACERVRINANSSVFADLRSQAKERMRSSDDELKANCEQLCRGLQPRLEIIGARLGDLDEDRAILINSLQKISAEVGTLLRRAEKSSIMPPDLGQWAHKPFIRIRFAFPETDEERRVRLEPLVDRLVAKGKIPGGLELVCKAVHELAGARGFEVSILKPDEVLRPEAIPIAAMSTFSRGQQLTAAILLYCTLVNLRAQSRGRRRQSAQPDGGILLLDNPIGTCSSVPMIELQRRIARIMGVQLIYATGVEDLEALDILPNKIRLRNASRAKGSGDYHVTSERSVDAVHVSFNEPTE